MGLVASAGASARSAGAGRMQYGFVPSWSPLQIPFVLAGWDFSLQAGANADPIASVIDRVTGTYPLTQSVGGNKPSILDAGINGLRVGSFTTTNYLIADALSALFTGISKPMTIYAVFKPTGFASTQTFAGCSDTAAGTHYSRLLRSLTSTGKSQATRRENGGAVTTSTGATTARTVNVAVAESVQFDGINAVNYRGVAGTADFPSSVISAGVTVTLNAFTVGAFRGTSVSEFAELQMGELWVANQPSFDLATHLKFTAYANKKWATA